jgi:16S rRNA (guanine(1405)-N(7))-methyltransferase
MDENLNELVGVVLNSSKYRGIHPPLVARIGAQELEKRSSFKEAIKATKNKLHQVGGAYLNSKFDRKRVLSWLASLESADGDEDQLRQACRQIMASHASTHERLPLLPEFYATVLADIPPVRSVIDVACGLNPLSIPWMPLAEDVTYHAVDIYTEMIDFLNQALPLLGVKGNAECRDVISEPPSEEADLALVLKSIPCLEQIDDGAGERLIDSLQAKFILVSFPARSLGGRDKGMLQNYGDRFRGLAEDKGWQIKEYPFTTELVFLLHKS